jgi:pyruvate,orthophosphate dikinase
MATKRVYFFGGGRAEGGIGMKDVLGGKGAALADMTGLGLPVPPGFTIAAEVSRLFLAGGGKLPADVNREIAANLAKLERTAGRRFGDPKNPLLLSVRSGAQFSMPGMMDTVLDLGMNDRIAEGLAAKSGDPRFAYDCYRRFLSMFGKIVLGVPGELFDQLLDEKRLERSAPRPTPPSTRGTLRTCAGSSRPW